MANEFLWSTVEVLLEGLIDFQPHSSSGACVVLNNIVKLRGTALKDQVLLSLHYFLFCIMLHIHNVHILQI